METANKQSGNQPEEASSVLTTAPLTWNSRSQQLKKYDQMQWVSTTPTCQGYVPAHTICRWMSAG